MPKRILPLFLTLCTSLYSAENITPGTVEKYLCAVNTPQTQVKKSDQVEFISPEGVTKKLNFSSVGTKHPTDKADYQLEVEGMDGLINFLQFFSFNQEYLFLPNLDDSENYIISMCPMNSSGDSYHILAYIILALSHGKTVPPVQLTYDSSPDEQPYESNMNNFTAIERTLNFSSMLSLRVYFKDHQYLNPEINAETKEKYKSPTYHQNVRQHNLRWTLPNFGTHFVDQKALTTLIVQHFLKYGRKDTIGRLRKGFSEYEKTDNNLAKVDGHVTDEYTRISKKLATTGDPLVIIHARYASTANDTQNIEGDAVKLKDYLAHNGYKTWFIIADGRSIGSSFKTLKNEERTDPFPHYLTKGGQDYGKFYHLRLLLKLTELPKVKIIGNTSGTLDLAALLGHDVYNLHVWNESMNYQCARILMQSAFLTLDLIKSNFLAGLQIDNKEWVFSSWLKDSKIKPSIASKDRAAAFSKPRQSGYQDLYNIHILPRPGIKDALILLPAFDSVMRYI